MYLLQKIECIQKCGSELERGMMENHIKNECPNTLFECKFKEFGCDEKIMRKDMEKKMKDDCVKHMLLLGGIFNKDILLPIETLDYEYFEKRKKHSREGFIFHIR